MYTKVVAWFIINSVVGYPSVKEIHNAYALHPVQINDFYAKTEGANTHLDAAPNPVGGTEADDIEETVKEVQELIKSNPKLPRLTRGEIIDIIENITKTDSTAAKTREEGKRALMVVMPFTAGSAQGDDIKELYTRTPVTHIIGGQAEVRKQPKKTKRKPSLPPLNTSEVENNYQFHPLPPQTTTVPPVTFTKISKHLVTSTTVSPTVINEKKIITKATTVTTPSLASVQSSTVQPFVQMRPLATKAVTKPQRKYPNHRYPDDTVSSSNSSQGGIHIINAPQFSPMAYDSKYSAPFTMSLSQLQPAYQGPKLTKPSTTQSSIIDDIPIPENYRNVVKDLNLLIDTDRVKVEKKNQDRGTIPKVVKQTTPRNFVTLPPKIPDISNVAENLSPDMQDLLMNFGLLNNPNKSSTVEIIPSIETTYQQQNAEINPESYLSFKPLPDSAPSRSEMEEFLARFGLGRSSFRSQKSIAVDRPKKEVGKNSEFNMDVIPNNMKHIMKDIGFVSNIDKVQTLNQISDHSKHVFNPSVQNATKEELDRLSKLLDMIKDLGNLNGSMTEDNLKNIDVKTLEELIGDFNGNMFVPLNERDAPNPLNFGNTEEKIGIKRQENTTTSTTSTTESPTERTETEGPNLLDLEASFGNQAEVAATTTPEPTTTTPRTGFYYLMDWNSFLELDNQLGRRINLRFQPHAGDPSQFLPVTVP